MPRQSCILALDTALQGCSVAVLNADTGLCAARSEAMGRGQSERLVPMIDEILAQAGVAYAALTMIAVTVGPGAFTGLRIGLSAARAYGTALDIPVIGVTTFDVLARQYAASAAGPFAIILETKRSDFYVQFFDESGRADGNPQACGHAAIAERLTPGMAVIGDGAARFNEATGQVFAAYFTDGYNLPDPQILASIGLERLRSSNPTPPEPLYLREADVSHPKNARRTIAGA